MSNGYALFAKETTYGTAPASGWRELEVVSDGHKTRQETLPYKGIGSRRGAPASTNRRIIDKGGEGAIEVGAFANGLGILLRAAASTATSAVVDGGTLAYEQVFTWTGAGVPAGRSFSAEFYRDRRSGTLDAFTYSGGKVTQLEIGSDLDKHVMFKFAVDYLTAVRQSVLPTRSPAVVVPDFIYAWPDGTHTLTPAGGSGADACIQSYSATLPNELDTEDWCLKAGSTRHEPSIKGEPAPTGTLTWRYEAPTYYDAFRAGTVFSLSSLWEAEDAIEDTTLPSLKVELPAIRFTGEDPELSESDRTMQNLPFEVLDNGTDPVCRITIVTSDTDF